MDTKLTLNVDKDLLLKAKAYAKDKGRSLSDLVENYFKTLVSKSYPEQQELSPKVKEMLGSYKLPEDFDYKKELSDRINEKYL
ncbi:MAG TPA: DUF6364 family protein [Bacteroidales bacterium]|jgi:uncharacterized protein (DUF3820 family)|nr:DUF6364 family protein [Bacteroidales bacterium]